MAFQKVGLQNCRRFISPGKKRFSYSTDDAHIIAYHIMQRIKGGFVRTLKLVQTTDNDRLSAEREA